MVEGQWYICDCLSEIFIPSKERETLRSYHITYCPLCGRTIGEINRSGICMDDCLVDYSSINIITNK